MAKVCDSPLLPMCGEKLAVFAHFMLLWESGDPKILVFQGFRVRLI
jgi:hypothetical protein